MMTTLWEEEGPPVLLLLLMAVALLPAFGSGGPWVRVCGGGGGARALLRVGAQAGGEGGRLQGLAPCG